MPLHPKNLDHTAVDDEENSVETNVTNIVSTRNTLLMVLNENCQKY